MSRIKKGVLAFVALALLAGGIVLGRWLAGPPWTEAEVREAVVTTIQQEAGASFFVTGTLTITASSTIEQTDYLLPRSFRIPLGSQQATVRMPGHVAYGFDIRALEAEDIQVGEDGVVEVRLPDLVPFSAEPDFGRMEVRTSAGGWQRWMGDETARTQLQTQALQSAQAALRRQAVSYLEEATQPRVNTAQALEALLTPPLVAAGVEAPRFRFYIGPQLVWQPEP